MEPANILEPTGFFAKVHPEKQRSLAALADLDSRDPLHVSATELFVFCSKAKRFAAGSLISEPRTTVMIWASFGVQAMRQQAHRE